jgi:HAD superfamily hydrolase (TIGR01459 family)
MDSTFNFEGLAENYDAFLVDLWGVVHDGTALYVGAKQCLQELQRVGKRVIFISNAPRRAHKAAKVLDGLGISRELYETVVTSGEVGYAALSTASPHPNPLPEGEGVKNRYFYIGPERDADVLNGLNYQAVALEDADFILNVGFGSEQDGIANVSAELKAAAARGLPMVCLNPDLEVVKISGARFPCAGAIAQEYEAIAGEVRYFGKPYSEIYERCLSLLSVDNKRILAIGDSLRTDIDGANRAGLDSLLIKGGILKNQPIPVGGILPTFVMDEWVW